MVERAERRVLRQRCTNHFFSEEFLNLGAQDLSQKLISRENKKLLHTPDEKSHGLAHNENGAKKNGQISDDLGLRSPIIQNNFRQKKVYLNTTPLS